MSQPHQGTSVKPRSQSHAGNGGFPQRKPFVAKGHDAILKDLQDSKKDVLVAMLSGETETGKIVSRDKFTITVQKNNGTGHRITIYKHAIESFSELAG